MNIIVICFLTFLCSLLFTGLTRHYAIRKSILDIPNERSSHQIPTPRGGGLAIVITFIAALCGLKWHHAIEENLFLALTGGGIIIAVIGYCDDIYRLSNRWRLCAHLLAAVWAIYFLGNFNDTHSGIYHLLYLSLYSLVIVIGIVWCINFYNFMDGIDGLAGGQGIFLAIAAALALSLQGATDSATTMWLFAATIAGFVVWNWPPAKIFLGDAGSGFLGYIFATFGLYTISNHLLTSSFWLLIFAVFLCDASFTVFYRMYQRKRWYSAHKEHAYQHVISYGASHKQVTMSILIINSCILLPIAFYVLYYPSYSLWVLVAAFLSLFLIWKRIKSLTLAD